MERTVERTVPRNSLAVLAALIIPLGIWLLASPYFLGYQPWTGARIIDGLFGPLIIGMAITRLAFWAPRYWWVSFGNVVFGLWVAITPFVLGYYHSLPALINNVVVGLLVALFAVTGILRQRAV